ncbi:hypothetical protein EHF33_13080 [Deinococcus psychrotolerans]|uniref:Uncharacterized protein n=1 Tax=Deinococcus psychrotolerans TaxID=2489213 RepID=A0A3G8YH83_9DEIO|nr:hypothetical protein [Deinococcus psychrotolerans]AZI43567.1 hypothetical protein EHF33_13080 [Deinococcus psychrotolerans]
MFTFAEAATLSAARVGQETHLLARFAARLPAAFVLEAEFEEAFYRRANLPEQLGKLFAPINPRRIDEDLLETLCARATPLVRTSALMDDSVQLLLRAVKNAGLASGEFHLRRPTERRSEGGEARPPSNEVLFALKRLWATDWTFEAVLARLDGSSSIALEARPVLIFAGPAGRPDPALAEELGMFEAWRSAAGLVGLA